MRFLLIALALTPTAFANDSLPEACIFGDNEISIGGVFTRVEGPVPLDIQVGDAWSYLSLFEFQNSFKSPEVVSGIPTVIDFIFTAEFDQFFTPVFSVIRDGEIIAGVPMLGMHLTIYDDLLPEQIFGFPTGNGVRVFSSPSTGSNDPSIISPVFAVDFPPTIEIATKQDVLAGNVLDNFDPALVDFSRSRLFAAGSRSSDRWLVEGKATRVGSFTIPEPYGATLLALLLSFACRLDMRRGVWT